MNIQKALEVLKDPSVNLGSVLPGKVFRFAHDNVIEAFKSDLFYMKLAAPELKGSCKIANVADGTVLVRDDCHRVIEHDASIDITP